jgi:hypothetical protein
MNHRKSLPALALALALCACSGLANAQSGSISLTIESLGGTASGTDTAEATTSLGAISKFDVAPIGFTLSRTATNWTLSSAVGIKVDSTLESTGYTLTAELGSAPSTGVTWELNGSAISDSSQTVLTSTGTYSSTANYNWDILIDDSATGAVIDNSIVFTAVSN